MVTFIVWKCLLGVLQPVFLTVLSLSLSLSLSVSFAALALLIRRIGPSVSSISSVFSAGAQFPLNIRGERFAVFGPAFNIPRFPDSIRSNPSQTNSRYSALSSIRDFWVLWPCEVHASRSAKISSDKAFKTITSLIQLCLCQELCSSYAICKWNPTAKKFCGKCGSPKIARSVDRL